MNGIMTIRPPDELQTALHQHAQKFGMTVNGLVLQILWDWIFQHSGETPDIEGGGRNERQTTKGCGKYCKNCGQPP